MRALTIAEDGLRLVEDAPVPTGGAKPEALIRVLLAGICSTDRELTRGYHGYLGIPGHEFVGEVVEAPSALAWVGRRVVGEINVACRKCDMCAAGLVTHCSNRTVLGIKDRGGSHAELLSLPISNLHAVPAGLPDEVAIFTEPLAAAFEPLDQGAPLKPGQTVVVIGDGKLGLLQARVFSLAGADVVLVGKHADKLAIAESWGLRTTHSDAPPSGRYELVAECTGSPSGLELALRLTRPRGTLVLKSTYAGKAGVDLAPIVVDEITVMGSRCGPFPEAIAALAAGRVKVQDLVDSTYSLADGLAAYQRAETPGVLKVLIRP